MLHLLSSADAQELSIRNSRKEVSREFEQDPTKLKKTDGVRQSVSEFPFTGSIKVTIKDKPIIESKEYQMHLLSWAFRAFLFHIQRTKRLYEIKLRTQERFINTDLQRYFGMWRSRVDEMKKAKVTRKSECEISDDQKIQLFVNAIVEKQKSDKSSREVHSTDSSSKKIPTLDSDRLAKSPNIADSSLQKRLSLQRKIITEQRMKLVRQNQIIEAMKLKRIAEESQHAKRETLTTAKQVLNKCRQETRNNLIQLMKLESSRGNDLDPPKFPPQPPDFLSRMEARAERRRERIREAREKQREKLELQKEREETTRREEEERQKQLRLEAQRRARRALQEQRRKKIIEAEKLKTVNELVARFYGRYLLRNYILSPFVRLIEEGKHHLEIADDHYSMTLSNKTFTIWKKYTREATDLKLERCTEICNTNILVRFFCEWMSLAKENIKKYKSAWNFYTSRLRGKYLRAWYAEVLEMRLRTLETLQFAMNHYDEKIKLKYLRIWQTYTKISDDVNESDRQKEKWRALVQHVVPNFCPKYRGVIRDD
ncbi:meiosis-specific nuclear structural protein 1 [Diachasma alloeum]|uniref:meiosis-specific nuclear structural protein 1 n=1 Tax=Diachasma alloeum TaxID=454923 RepID=UPI00073823D2|nr:meiosis-specific nuclear structural protein 1 [Diachasma alloeum]